MNRKSTLNPRVLLTVGLVLCGLNSWGQKNNYWQNAPAEQGGPLAGAIVNSRTVSVNINALRTYLNAADIPQAGKRITVVTKTMDWAFPLPDGSTRAVKVVRNKTLSDALAIQNPLIKTYTGYDAEGIPCMRLTVSPVGVAGFVNTEKGQVYLAPVKGNPSMSVSFYTNDLKAISGTIQCGTEEQEFIPSEGIGEKPLGFVDNQMRDYTISIAATGEYTAWAGSQANALATITTSINNVNAVYERDLAIHFTLNSPNAILFPDASIDPYSGTSSLSSTQLNQNQVAVDLAIGNANYDLSVVYNAGWSGGLAQLSSTCNSTGKARSAAGLDPAFFTTGPSGPVFDMTVAHEVGHQFSATHSFSANTGGCNGNVSGNSAWEPGGGSTIMAYAGTCTGLAYQSNSDAYFHGGNLGQMSAFLLTGTGSSCATLSPLSNALPILNKISYTYTIPRNTPFKLRAPAADANGDALTYCWEQLNPFGGTGTNSLPSALATSGPLFRSFPPTTEETRYFPNLPDYASGIATPYEVLPNTTRTMNFLLTARDNHSGAGATDTQNIVINVSSCGAFSFTSHITASAAAGGSSTSLTWNTASACVTCNNIDILFSKDGGKTFPYTVLSGTPNDGTESVIIPNVNTCDGRFMIACSDNIFYNINAGAITVSTPCLAEGTTVTPVASVSALPGSPSLNLTMNPVYGSAIATPIAGSITTANASSTVAVLNSGAPCINFNGNIVRYTTYNITPSVTGLYTFNAAGSTFGLVYTLYNNEYLPDAPCQNMITSSGNYNGSSSSLSNSITATLCAQKRYVLLVSSFSSSTPVLPAPYSIAVTGPAGFALYNGVPPPAGYNYVYAIVNNTNGNIVHIAANSDLSSAINYPTGNYTIYGVSTSATAATLDATYAGGSFVAFNTAANNATICANISANTRSVQVSTPLPLDMTAFSAKLLSAASAEIKWEVSKENNIAKYELERGYNAMAFESITTVLPGVQENVSVSYNYTDGKFNRSENQLLYRLKISDKEGHVRYSNIERLLLDKTKDFSLRISPNPVQHAEVYFNLTIPQSGIYSASIIDETGRVLYVKTQNFVAGTNHCTIPAESLSKGVYYLKVQGSNGVLNARFVKL